MCAATSATPAASNKHRGEYTSVSRVANRLPRTRLKKPTYLNSPMARANRPRANARDNHDKSLGGTFTSSKRPVAATKQAKRSNTRPTLAVALADGTNNGLPATLGTAPPSLATGHNAMRKCQSASATNTPVTHQAMTVFNGI